MPHKLLIDECLSPELVNLAYAAGHYDATCIRDLGLSGTKDPQVLKYVLAHGFILVTHNAADFRGHGISNPGGLYNALKVPHPGLICLSSEHPPRLERQKRLFQLALDELAQISTLAGHALEIFESKEGTVTCELYMIP